MAKKQETGSAGKDQSQEIEHINKRLELLDQRLDNIDSIVSAVAERVMKQALTFNVTCPKCGQNIEIALIGNEKLNRKS